MSGFEPSQCRRPKQMDSEICGHRQGHIIGIPVGFAFNFLVMSFNSKAQFFFMMLLIVGDVLAGMLVPAPVL